MKRKLAAVAAAIAAATAGTIALTTSGSTPAACPAGQSYLGCSIGAAAHPAHTNVARPKVSVTAPVPGCIFPDVSSFQGHPDWPAAASHICAAVAKAGEAGFEDPDFVWNVGQLRALHIPWSGYWFVRGCDEGPAFAGVLNGVGFKGDRDALRPVLDMEVPSAAGCAVPIARVIHADFGVWPIVYTAPGTWPGGAEGGLDAWEADYTLGARAALPFAAPVIGWQRYSPPFTDLSIPGLGTIDESIDIGGFSRQLAFPVPPPKPSPFLIYPLPRIRLFGQKVSERLTVETWWRHGCANPVRREVCKSTRTHLIWLAGRLVTLAERGQRAGEFNLPPDWSSPQARKLKWPERHWRIERILNG